MDTLLFWIYLLNLVILTCHEIDSAYWKEWTLFGINDTNAIQGFVLIHIPILVLLILGLFWVKEMLIAGFIISLILSFSGVFAFFFHFFHLHKGRPEFNNLTSKMILFSTLILSVTQIILTVLQF